MIRSRRPVKSTEQLKEEQYNYLLEDIERKLRDNQIAVAKKYFRELKKSCNSVVQENQQLKEYIKNIKKGTKSTYSSRNRKNSQGKETIFGLNHHQKNIKKYSMKN